MAFSQHPVVNVKTSDTTGYIIEFLTQSNIGPNGCVRVRTRDVLKLTAISQTIKEIVPQVSAPATGQTYTITPDIVTRPTTPNSGIGCTPIILKNLKGDGKCKHHASRKRQVNVPCSVQTCTPSTQDASCCTESCPGTNVCSQTSSHSDQSKAASDKSSEQKTVYVKIVDEPSNEKCDSSESSKQPNAETNDTQCDIKTQKSSTMKRGNEIEETPSGSNDSQTDCDRPKKKKCTCGLSNDKNESKSMDVDAQCQTADPPQETQNSEVKLLCIKCSSKSLCATNACQTNSTPKEDKETCCDDKNKTERKTTEAGVQCNCNKDNSRQSRKMETEQNIYDIYKNDDYDEDQMNHEPIDDNLCQIGHTNTNSVSLMNIDITHNNYKKCGHSDSSSATDYYDTSDEESFCEKLSRDKALCSRCRSKSPVKSKKQSKDKKGTRSKCSKCKDRSTNTEDTEQSKMKSGTKQKKKSCCRDTATDKKELNCKASQSSVNMSDVSTGCPQQTCGTSMDTELTGGVKTKVIRLTDECIQCVATKCQNVCVDTTDQSFEETPAPKLSITESIKNFVMRYVWGDPITQDCSTQASEPKKQTVHQCCFAWNPDNHQQMAMRHGSTNTQPFEDKKCNTKDSSTQMDVDDNPSSGKDDQFNTDDDDDKGFDSNPKDQKPSVLKKNHEKPDSDSSSSSSLNSKRSVIFRPQASVFDEKGGTQDVEIRNSSKDAIGGKTSNTHGASSEDDENDENSLKRASLTSLIGEDDFEDDTFASVADGKGKGSMVSDPNANQPNNLNEQDKEANKNNASKSFTDASTSTTRDIYNSNQIKRKP